MPSFDIVSRVDLQEVDNALNQARKEIVQRYDFKGTNTQIEWDAKGEMVVTSKDEYRVKAAVEVVQGKLARRGVPLKALDYGPLESSPSGRARQVIRVQQGIDADRAREIVKVVKGLGLKVQAQVLEAQVRISGKKRDDLQAVIARLRGEDLGIPLQFVNYRD